MSGALSATSVLSLAGAGLSAVSAVRGSQASKAAYNAQAQIAANNAQIAGWQAEDAVARGTKAASTQRLRTNQMVGTQRARLAANGVDLGVGSALEILTDTQYFGEIDVNTITDNAAREAWAIRQQAAGYTAESSLFRNRAASESPLLAGATSLLTSAGRVAGNWYGTKAATGGSVNLGTVRGTDMDRFY